MTALLILTGAAQASAAPGSGRHYYLDCAAGNDAAAGVNPQSAWRSLARASAVTYRPGDRLLLRRGVTCHGVLAPQGSGTRDLPIVVTGYRSGSPPAIDGGAARAAVYLYNVEGWELRGLDISNPGAPDGSARGGVYVHLHDYGIGRHYVVDRVRVHDVVGCDCTGPEAEPSGGIVFKATGTNEPTGFDGVTVSRNHVSGVDGYGIATSSQWNRRPQNPGGTGSFVPMSGVHITGNWLDSLRGSGVVVQNGLGALVEWNRIDGFALGASTNHLGMYTWNSDDSVLQYNEVSGGDGSQPNPAFGAEAGNSNLLMQYNFSRGNAGFIYLCSDEGMLSDRATIRYNVSQHDQNTQVGPVTAPLVTNCFGDTTTNLRFFNNAVYSGTATSIVGMFSPIAGDFRNNIFVGGASGATIDDPSGSYQHNLYHNVPTVPAGDTSAVTGDPLLTDPDASGFDGLVGYRLRCGSPAIGSGITIAGDGGTDLYGNPLPPEGGFNIGVHQGSCIAQ